MKKILFISTSRADYGLLKPLIKKFQHDRKFKTSLIVTGTHLSKTHGNTFKEIVKDRILKPFLYQPNTYSKSTKKVKRRKN